MSSLIFSDKKKTKTIRMLSAYVVIGTRQNMKMFANFMVNKPGVKKSYCYAVIRLTGKLGTVNFQKNNS